MVENIVTPKLNKVSRKVFDDAYGYLESLPWAAHHYEVSDEEKEYLRELVLLVYQILPLLKEREPFITTPKPERVFDYTCDYFDALRASNVEQPPEPTWPEYHEGMANAFKKFLEDSAPTSSTLGDI